MSELTFIEGRAEEKLHVQRGDLTSHLMLCGHTIPLHVGLTHVGEHEADESEICKRCLKAARP